MIFVARCGSVGSEVPFQLRFVGDFSPVQTTLEIYPSRLGLRFGDVTWQATSTIRSPRMVFVLGKTIGGLFNILATSEAFTVNPRQDGSGLAVIRSTNIGVPVIDRLYMSFIWTNCQNAPPYAVQLSYAGTISAYPVGMTFNFNLRPLLDQVTPCSG